jgi:hypothetical protein
LGTTCPSTSSKRPPDPSTTWAFSVSVCTGEA